jgi:tetratricopeptide (TPR) repeat protein
MPDALVVHLGRSHALRTLHEALRAVPAGDDAPPLAGGRRDEARRLAAALLATAAERALCVIADDAHVLDDALLDALELVAMTGGGARFWALCAADPAFEQARPGFGARARSHVRLELGPLDGVAARQLAADRLAPAEYPSEELLDGLVRWADRNPACIVEIAHALHVGGYVRSRPDGRASYLEGADLAALPRLPAWHWLGARTLEALPAELGACALVCAVLGMEVETEELAAVLDALDRTGATATPLDAGVGLRSLAARGVVRALDARDRFAFRTAALREALYDRVPEDRRREVHRHALDFRREQARGGALGDAALDALVRHAAAIGEAREAGSAAARLGDRARARHQHAAASAHYSTALGHLQGDACRRERALALLGRASSRYRIARASEALGDLDEAMELATALGDGRTIALVLLVRATALDWAADLAASAACAREAAAIVRPLGDGELDAELDVALGRTSFREGAMNEAVELLARGAAAAERCGAHAARVVALLLLSCALVQVGRLDEAADRFEEVLRLCEATGDHVHASAAYCNRAFLWSARNDVDRCLLDLGRSVDRARRAGNAWVERAATLNYGELAFFAGRDDDALPYVERGRWLEERFGDRPTFEGTLLSARVQAARGRLDEAAAWAAKVARACPPPDGAQSAAAQLWAVTAVVARERGPSPPPEYEGAAGPAAWAALLEASRGCMTDERLELLYWQMRWAVAAGEGEMVERTVREAAALHGGHGAWSRRFEQMGGVGARGCG